MSSARTYRLYSTDQGLTNLSRYYCHGDPVLDIRAFSLKQAFYLANRGEYSSDGSSVGLSSVL